MHKKEADGPKAVRPHNLSVNVVPPGTPETDPERSPGGINAPKRYLTT